jgi:hypothetical protein
MVCLMKDGSEEHDELPRVWVDSMQTCTVYIL